MRTADMSTRDSSRSRLPKALPSIAERFCRRARGALDFEGVRWGRALRSCEYMVSSPFVGSRAAKRAHHKKKIGGFCRLVLTSPAEGFSPPLPEMAGAVSAGSARDR